MRGVTAAAAILLASLACSKGEQPCPTCSGAVRSASVHLNPAPAQAPVRLGPGITPPVLIQRVEPTLPDELKRGRQAFVSFEATIDAEGNVTAVRWVGANDEKVLPYVAEAVKRWKFRPASRNGEPLAVLYDISFTFEVR